MNRTNGGGGFQRSPRRGFRRGAGLLVLVAFILLAVHLALFWDWTSDDAYISFRYAENLAAGRGLVFNPGERVEGYSNFTWVILIALAKTVGLPPVLTAKAFGALAAFLLLGLWLRAAAEGGLGERSRLTGLWMLAVSTGLAYFAMSGLETVAYTVLIFAAVVFELGFEQKPEPRRLAAVYAVLILVALSRPEGAMFLLLSVAYHVGQRLTSGRGLPLKTTLLTVASTGLVFAAFLVFRWLTFGSLVPNTFYAKPPGTFVDGPAGALIANLTGGLGSASFLVVLIPVLMVGRKGTGRLGYALLIILGQLVFLAYAGDWMAFGRFFLPVAPVVLLTFFVLLEARRRAVAAALAFATLAGLVVANVWQTRNALAEKDRFPYLVMRAERLVDLAHNVESAVPAGAVIALRRQGAVPYISGLHAIDTLGLTHRAIARIIHRDRDPLRLDEKISGVVLAASPDLILLFASRSEEGGRPVAGEDPRFRLPEAEHRLLERAESRGYRVLRTTDLGPWEKAVWVERQ
ncbi:MAG: hypothetical protein OEW05_03615 [Candidatus Aminicenantes bacterium]|nr:hypothetical protein [Candidatus Aminicenantes bacterium]